MIFWLTISALIIIALSIITLPFWHRKSAGTIDNQDMNILLYKRRLGELENDLSNDILDKDQYDIAISELKLQLLSDVPEEKIKQSGTAKNQYSGQTVLGIVILVPLISISLYFLLGNRDVATGNIMVTKEQTMPDIEKMVSGLAKRLQSQPNDVRGWLMLGRSYMAMSKFDQALKAYEKAYALAPEDPDILTYYAETIAILHNNQLKGKPLRLITKALEINQHHPRALWLAGHGQLQLGNKKKAIQYWQTLLSILPPGHESTQTVQKFIAQVGGQAGLPAQKQAGTGNPGIKIRVTLAPELKAKAPENATVFIFARPAKGPKMPLAGVKLNVANLPTEVVLGDGNAMIPGRTISSVDQVIIGARISKSGGPVSKPGDLEGFSPVISSMHPGLLNITINQIAK